PSTRELHAMAYDAARGVSVLFGGFWSSSYYGDTWEWNGSSWTLRSSDGPLRRGHALAYDAARRVTVLFGGDFFDGSTIHFLGDTWEWDGGAWALRSSGG